mmetsp:Transcript_17613/g.38425  ORF Transcript_17613/g.38425 Transcript_17613/m.38425 type:complete len:454 (-) Transcript_17613:147-1508(-)
MSSLTPSTPSSLRLLRQFIFVDLLLLFLITVTLTTNEAMAFGLSSIPQPTGLSPELITSLARKRYKVNNVDNNDNNNIDDDGPPMHGNVAVITGAAGGIGRELSRVVYNLGGTVVAIDRNVAGLDSLVQDLACNNSDRNSSSNSNEEAETPPRIICIPTQHEDLESVARSAEEIKSRFDSIDLLVNNAGLTYPLDKCKPGMERMKAKNGYDLAFIVNYLSHFLLVEKLLPHLQASPSGGRIVHITSTYHYKVDGSELIPRTLSTSDGKAMPMAYQSDPALMSSKHVERAYANTKLAQIWHSRSMSIRGGVPSVCACPTWAGTGIAGEEKREFMERFAFPVAGAGIASALNAMFRSDEELGDALSTTENGGQSIVANSRTVEYLPLKNVWMSDWVTKLGWRDGIVDFAGLILLYGQWFTFGEFLIQRSSPESYNNKSGRDALYEWSLKEVEPWL